MGPGEALRGTPGGHPHSRFLWLGLRKAGALSALLCSRKRLVFQEYAAWQAGASTW